MRTFVITLIALAALAAVASAQEVLVVGEDNWDQVHEDNPLLLVEFYAPWCGHCKKLEPEYEKAAEILNGEINIAKVDATVHSALAGKYGVRGYPTIKLFRNGEVSTDYKGQRTGDAIAAYMKKQAEPSFVAITEAESEEFSAKSNLVLIARVAEGSDAEAAVKAACEMVRDHFSVGIITADANTVTLHKNVDNEVIAYDGDFDAKAIAEWASGNKMPLIDEVGPENYSSYVDTKLPMGMLFVQPDAEDKDALIEMGRAVAAAFRGKAVFVWVDSAKYIAQAKKVGLSGDIIPAFAVDDIDNQKHYAYDETADLTEETITAFVQGVLDGEIEETVKSEPVPANNDGPVTVVVGSTLQALVEDTTKDVFIEFYAPWCGHCKKLVPIWDELGEKFADIETVTIAKMDATANDAPGMGVKGFPTLVYFKAGGDRSPVRYNGGRTLDDFVSYLEANKGSDWTLAAGDDAEETGDNHDHSEL